MSLTFLSHEKQKSFYPSRFKIYPYSNQPTQKGTELQTTVVLPGWAPNSHATLQQPPSFAPSRPIIPERTTLSGGSTALRCATNRFLGAWFFSLYLGGRCLGSIICGVDEDPHCRYLCIFLFRLKHLAPFSSKSNCASFLFESGGGVSSI
jgi:hypothetical protein